MKLTSIAAHLPGDPITSVELDRRCGLKPGQIEKSTGVCTRHHAPVGTTLAGIAAAALDKALKHVNLGPADLDLLMFTGGSFEQPIPHTSCLVKALLADDRYLFPCVDVDSTCLSFVNGLDIAHLYLSSGRYRRIAVVSAEMPSRAIRPDDPGVYGLFGDAAVAMIIESGAGYEPTPGVFQTFSSGARLAQLRYGGALERGLGRDPVEENFWFQMDGRAMMHMAQKHIGGFVAEVEKVTGLGLENFGYIIPHQASKLGNAWFIRQYSLAPERVRGTLASHGNCISASIALGLESVWNSGAATAKNVLLIGTAAGLSIGALALRFK